MQGAHGAQEGMLERHRRGGLVVRRRGRNFPYKTGPLSCWVHATISKETLGSFKPIDLSSNDLLEIVQLNIDRMNSLGNHRFYFGLEKILNAWLQMVSGMNYRIEYVVRKTNCSKIDFRKMRSENCRLDKNGESGRCSIYVHSDLQGHMNVTNLNCYTESGYCLNCPNAIKQNDPELLSLLVQFIDEFNANNSHPFLYKLLFVKQATKKGLHPTTYRVHIQMKETNCSKNEYAILGEECGFTNTSGLLDCDVKMYVKDETVAQSHKCRSEVAFLLRYQGYSPLRASMSMGDHGSQLQNEHHGKKETQSEKEKKKAGFNKDREVPTPVPESSVAERCPGKVWQQNMKQAHAPFELVADPPTYYHKQERRPLRGNMPHFA
uniref:Cystatin kininogen-type domain-containing protein n=1 Tax=Leptobrachium leishanense TaxID=445787 RepID=A0A8C5M7E3_9ANUR